MKPIILESTEEHSSTLIFLHGLGDTGNGWCSTVAKMRPSHMKVICPTAGTMPVTLYAGFKMHSWFDLRSIDTSVPEDEEGILRATNNIHQMIDAEIENGIPSNRILVGGFSQGGALALYSALTFTKPLGGVIALSCWLPLHKKFPTFNFQEAEIPIFQAHGDVDTIVPLEYAKLSASILKVTFKNTQFKTYNGLSHSSSDQELQDIRSFIDNCFEESIKSSQKSFT